MVLKSVPFAVAIALVLAWGGIARADDYKPDDYLSLDLSKAVLSPKRLGPPSEFAPLRVEAESEPSGVLAHSDPRAVAVQRVEVAHARRSVHALATRPHVAATARRGAARVRLAHRHGNPMNAQARDTRIQKWPCNPDSGGICNWQ